VDAGVHAHPLDLRSLPATDTHALDQLTSPQWFARPGRLELNRRTLVE
jgi:hypothetical protein